MFIETKNLYKYFDTPKGKLHAVDNVNLSIKEGETLGVVGESGCGKSTLGRVILRLHEADSGNIYYNGMDITKLNNDDMRKMRRFMQIIFQDPYSSLNPRYTVAEIISEPLSFFKIYDNARDRKARVEEIMDIVGLSKRSYNMYPHEFDGGRRQRIVIARTLSINPKFIVCDEPVSALDVSIQAQIINLLMDLQKELKLTYMFISHDLSVIKHISNNISVMYLGEIIESCDKKTLFENPKHPYTKALLSAIPTVDVNKKKDRILLRGEVTSPINPKKGCRFYNRCPYAEDNCLYDNVKLRDIGNNHLVSCIKS
ncbi:ATP-binding cassette domain-containing protein [Brachyspira pilosicoli]|uniref:ABC transporter ATP-binding protein n=1 Tax=Brachyspira pilosicoli TaxID=52584 RepID=UPI0030076801